MWLFVSWLVDLMKNSACICTHIFLESKYWLGYREIRNLVPTPTTFFFKTGSQVAQAFFNLYITEDALEPLDCLPLPLEYWDPRCTLSTSLALRQLLRWHQMVETAWQLLRTLNISGGPAPPLCTHTGQNVDTCVALWRPSQKPRGRGSPKVHWETMGEQNILYAQRSRSHT